MLSKTPKSATNLPAALCSTKDLTKEQTMNYVLCSFREDIMFRAVVEEAAALTSLALFIGMIAIWAQVFSVL